MGHSLAVVKVGGSLYDMPDLGTRLQSWLKSAPAEDVLLVPGGGSTADVIREFDRIHQLGEFRAHILALESLRLNACFLANLLPGTNVLVHWEELQTARLRRGGSLRLILDVIALTMQERNVPPFPHCWAFTSDSIAARAAVVAGAEHLILLKSVTMPQGMDWEEAGKRGFVDEWFAPTVRPALPGLKVRAVNFREWTP